MKKIMIVTGGEPGQGRRVKSAVPLLLSNEASYSTGAILDVAGGR
jgi:NAD(P)-dependent dehydrogenase (short-subunit alcohol dehydrogenase family)